MENKLLSHKTKVFKLSEIVTNKKTQNKPMYAIDINRWGVSKPFSDPENATMYRDSISELVRDTFIGDDEDLSTPHYINAPTGSIHDY